MTEELQERVWAAKNKYEAKTKQQLHDILQANACFVTGNKARRRRKRERALASGGGGKKQQGALERAAAAGGRAGAKKQGKGRL